MGLVSLIVWYLIVSMSDSVIIDKAKSELAVLLTLVKDGFTSVIDTSEEFVSSVVDTSEEH
jgi:hypothetical protein